MAPPLPALNTSLQKGDAAPKRNRVRPLSDFANVAAPDKRNELVPFGVRQPDGVGVLPDCDAFIGDHDFESGPSGAWSISR